VSETKSSYYDVEDGLATEQVARAEQPPPCQFTTGCAGTGKTYNAVKAVRDDPSSGILSSTTGISAVNLGAITINSLLKYSDVKVMRDHFLTGALSRVLHSLAKQYRTLIVDEISMFGGNALDILYRAVEDANRYVDVPAPMGIHIIGDMAQLPPVNAPWVFTASCWERFRENTETLTKVWRQGDTRFLSALNLVRCGEGAAAADALTSLGASFETALDTEFDGTTILPRNDQVGRYNALALDRVPGQKFRVTSRRWGQQRSEWGQSIRTKEWGIPPEVELKIGAYVMLLANHPEFEWVNGDCGWIEAFDDSSGPFGDDPGGMLAIRLVRTKQVIHLSRLTRGVEHSERPAGWFATADRIPPASDDGGWHPRPHYRGRVKRWVTGQVEYWPLRLAYATTVHKSQSLTLDRVQCDFRGHFFQQPAMLYVALSRCRTLEGLRLVGMAETFAKHCNFDERIREWL
jgi:ATP-dependent DNA helicase PIF1